MKWLLVLIALLMLPVAVFGGLIALVGVALVLMMAVVVPILPFILGVLLVLLIVKLLRGPKDTASDQIVAS